MTPTAKALPGFNGLKMGHKQKEAGIDNRHRILAFAAEQPNFTVQQAAAHLGLAEPATALHVKRLLTAGAIIMISATRRLGPRRSSPAVYRLAQTDGH